MSNERTYRIHEVIGRGGFGTVYRATFTGEGGFSKDVAVKLLNPDVDGYIALTRRLRDEARLLGMLRHRSILQVDGLVKLQGRWAVVTEFIHGVSLLKILQHRVIPVGVAVEVVGEVASALHAAYTHAGEDGRPLHLIHRDIKPANVQLTRAGEVKLLDFGIARADFAREAETTELLMGSLSYMSPERLDMLNGPEGDIYALGVVLCEMIGGKKFQKTSANRERHDEHVEQSISMVRERIGAKFDEIEELVRSMLVYDPEGRPTAKQVERVCRRLRGSLGEPWMADWADHFVPRIIDQKSVMPDDSLVGQTVAARSEPQQPAGFEDDETTRVRPDDVGAGAPAEPSRRRWLLAVGVLGLVLVGVVFGVAGLQARSVAAGVASGVTGTDPDVLDAGDGTAGAELDTEVPVEPDGPEGDTEVVEADTEADTEAVTDGGTTPEPDGGTTPELGEGTAGGDGVADVPSVDPPPPPPPIPDPPVAATAGPRATTADFAAWVGQHPEWGREAAIDEGRADTNHLRGWVEGQPPAGTATYITNVSWWAAQEFCAGRGGLAALSAEPVQWSETEVFQEWRVEGGQAAWRRFDGETSRAVRRSDCNAFTGFRCAR